MMCFTLRTSTAYWSTDIKFTSIPCGRDISHNIHSAYFRMLLSTCTIFAMFLCTNTFPGSKPSSLSAGTRASEHPILPTHLLIRSSTVRGSCSYHKYSGWCVPESLLKKPGSRAVLVFTHCLLASSSSSTLRCTTGWFPVAVRQYSGGTNQEAAVRAVVRAKPMRIIGKLVVLVDIS